MKREYFTINEATAKQARTMNSFYEYKENESTNSYKNTCNNVYELAEEVAEKRPEYAEKLESIAIRYAEKYASWINTNNSIDCMCPSVMVCGAGNFPVAKKNKQNARRDKHMQELEYINGLVDKIKAIQHYKEVIKSSDNDAIEKLQEKLNKLEMLQADMKKANAYYKKNNTLKGCEVFTDYTEEKIAELDKSIAESWTKKPFESYQLTNNNAKIKNTKARIAELEKVKERGMQEVVISEPEEGNELFKVVENTELMRLQLLFDGKPSDAVRDLVKKNGFKWSPKNSAWQRQLTDNARYSLKRIKPELEKLLSA